MRCTLNFLALALLGGTVLLAQGPNYHLGRTPTTQEMNAWDVAIGPSGKELPSGSGTAEQGAKIYAARCSKCHGPDGMMTPQRMATYPHSDRGPLKGGQGSLKTPNPMKTVGSYWPYATTVWDYIHRAMPQNEEGTLSAEDAYALTALLLYWNGIIKETDVLDAKTLPKIQMPNRNGFLPKAEELRRWRCPVGTCP